MNEATSIFMTMIESTLNKMIDNRIEAKAVTLTERLETIHKDNANKVFDLTQRIMALEIDNAALQILLKDGTPTVQPTDDVILRLDKMREDTDSLMNCQDHDQMENSRRITELEQCQSAFAVQIGSLGIDQRDDAKRIEALEEKTSGAMVTIDLQSEEFRNAVREIAEAAAEEAVDSHCGDYDHDDIHVDEVDEDAMDTAVRQALKYAYIALK